MFKLAYRGTRADFSEAGVRAALDHLFLSQQMICVDPLDAGMRLPRIAANEGDFWPRLEGPRAMARAPAERQVQVEFR
jgi:hypothetical protein